MEPSRVADVAEVLERARAPRPAFDEFYLREYPRLTALAAALAGTSLADDVAQEAMLVAYRKWGQVGQLERPDLWVRRICSNLAVSQFRRRLVEIRAVTRLAARRQPPAELGDTGRELWAAIAALPERQAQVAALRFVYDMPIADIAVVLGCSEGTVKVHLHRWRAALATSLGLDDSDQDGAAS